METLGLDIRFGMRMLVKSPGFMAVAVLTLALGIGANTTIFSVLNAVLFEPLPLPDAGQVVTAFGRTTQSARTFISYPDFQDWRKQSKSFDAMSAAVGQSVNLTGREEPARLIGSFVSADFFRVVAVPPLQGRVMRLEEGEPGGERVVVVSERAWKSIFGADPQLVGNSLTLNNEPYTVIGIYPSLKLDVLDSDIYLPFHKWPNFSQDRKQSIVWTVARLKAGVTLAEARAEADTIFSRLAQQYPDTNADRRIQLLSLHELLAEDLAPSLYLLAGAVGLVLLIACGNVANLLLARGAARQRELATRLALGAGRIRLVRQLMTETALLWLAGGGLGLLAGFWGTQGLMQLAPSALPTGNEPVTDLRVLGFTLGLSLATGLLFGLVPALRFSRPNLTESLKESSRTSTGGAVRRRLLRGLAIAQTALTLVLLVGAGLMVRSFLLALAVDPGFDTKNVLTMEYRLPRNKYPEGAQQNEFHQRVVERLQALPGVESACVVRALPLSQNAGRNFVNFTIVGQPEPPPGEEPRALVNFTDNFFFETFRIPVLQGRTFEARDHAGVPNVVVINEAMRRRFWPQGDAMGRSIRVMSSPPVTATIIGVVGNIKNTGPEESEQLQFYAPQTQFPFIFNTLAVRTKGDPLAMVREVRAAVWSVDREQPVWAIRTLESLLGRATAFRRFVTSLLAGYSALAVALAGIGLYGVVAYGVAQRTHEFGVRLALGAQPGQVLQLVLRNGLLLILAGVGVGLAGALTLTRLMGRLLYGVAPHDPTTFAGVTLLLLCVALAACWIPARRATRVDPMVALRYE